MKKRKHLFLIIIFLAAILYLAPVHAFPAKDFDQSKYHNYAELTKILKGFQSKYSNLAKLHSLGKSVNGKDLWLLEVTNHKKGKAAEKPALFINGGLRGNEVVTTEVCLYTAKYLLDNYNKMDDVKKLLDSRTFYIVPAVNPDACDFTVKNPGKPMVKNFREVDEDLDGKVNEDAADDLNKDGFISMMRVKEKNGQYKINKLDARFMSEVNAKKGEKGEYKLMIEGIDNDKDEKYNEDGVGGVDLNHNFPSGWKMNYEQAGAGMYPGSEPESEALMRFLIDHPNVTFVVAFQSGEGKLYRPFDHLADKEIPSLDQKVYEKIGEKYKELTGLPLTHGFPEKPKKASGPNRGKVETKSAPQTSSDLRQRATARRERSTKQKVTQKKKPIEYGTFLDWAYKDYNVYSFCPSVWTLPREYKSDPDTTKKGLEDKLAWLKFFEKEWGGKGFVPWKKYKHPQLGEVEIGGWSCFYKKNPPAGDRLKKLCKDNAKFCVELAEMTPRLEIKEIEINPIQVLSDVTKAKSSSDADGTIKISQGSKKITGKAVIAEIKIKVENTGNLGSRTALGKKTRYSHQQPRSVLVSLEEKNGKMEILSIPRILRLGVIEGTETKDLVKTSEETETRNQPQGRQEQRQQREQKKKEDEDEPNIKSGKWLVKIEGGSAELIFRVKSEKAGTLVKKVRVEL